MKVRAILSAKQMIEKEKQRFKSEEPSLSMERASKAMALWLLNRYPYTYCLILAGPGGNGGDAWGLARWLRQAGWDPLVIYQEPSHPLTKEQRAQSPHLRQMPLADFLKRQQKASSHQESLQKRVQEPFGIIVDGLLGIGARGALKEEMASLVEWANRQKAQRIGLDCPTGWPEPFSTAFCADYTLCVDLIKSELLEPKVRALTGELHLVSSWPKDDSPFIKTLTPSLFEEKCSWMFEWEKPESLLPKPEALAHKYQRGVIYLVAGSESYPGAGQMVERAAWHFRPGVVYSQNSDPIIDRTVPLPLPPKRLRPNSCLLIGSGLGRSFPALDQMVKWLEAGVTTSYLLLDGDSLYHLAKNPELWKLLPHLKTLLTPHEGELNLLLLAEGLISEEEIKLEGGLTPCKRARVQQLAHKRQVSILAKGPVTYLLGPKGEPLVEPFGRPYLAIAGSGDQLVGLIASALSQTLLSQTPTPSASHELALFKAVAIATRLHAKGVETP